MQQALHQALPLHLHQASAITLSKIKSKGRYINLSLNITSLMHVHVHVLILIKMFNMIVSFFTYIVEMAIFNIYYVHRAATPKVTRVTIFVFCTLSHDVLHF